MPTTLADIARALGVSKMRRHAESSADHGRLVDPGDGASSSKAFDRARRRQEGAQRTTRYCRAGTSCAGIVRRHQNLVARQILVCVSRVWALSFYWSALRGRIGPKLSQAKTSLVRT